MIKTAAEQIVIPQKLHSRSAGSLQMESHLQDIHDSFEALLPALAPHLTPDMTEWIVSAPDRGLHLHGKKQNLTVLFASTRSEDAESRPEIFNQYYALAVDAVSAFDGIVDKFHGDCIMATFGPIHGRQEHQYRAAACAVQLRDSALKINLQVGIGAGAGAALVGSITSPKRVDHTAIGAVVRNAYRLQSISKPGQILISEETWRPIAHDLEVHALGHLSLPRQDDPVSVYSLHRLLS